MSALPEGTVTLLFTDIEGSTRLLQDLGDDYEELLTDHRRLLRGQFEANGGIVVDMQGDAFLVAFRRARDAVSAAAEAQRAVATHDWPGSADLRVRMAIHTGEPSKVNTGFVGLAVHRAARICAAGHGGQVLLSATTRDLVEDHLPSGMALLDLGEHRLKDVDRPETIVQLITEGVPPVFTPLKTLEHQSTRAPFAGQEEHLAAAAEATFAAEPGAEAGKSLGRVARARAVAGARTLDWRGFVHLPGHSRFANRLEGLGTSIHSTGRLASRDDLRAELQGLGRAFVTAAREARSADRLLRKEDLSALRRRVSQHREGAYVEPYLRNADELVMQTAALEGLVEARRQFEKESRRLEPWARALRGRVFDARLDSAKLDDLLFEIRPMRESAEGLAATFQQACDRAWRAFPTH
jgi:class 3 adenylate cyclase